MDLETSRITLHKILECSQELDIRVPEVWHGAHNLFGVFLGVRRLSRQKVKKICKEDKLDGVILLKVKSENKILMKFYNPDGTRDNCGNGLRVAARYCYIKGLVNSSGIIASKGLTFAFFIKGEEITITFPRTQKVQNTWNVGGVLHKVVHVNSIEQAKKEAPLLRKKYDSNITFVKQLHQAVFAQTFERGVERFTASCGTGAIAAAIETGASQIFMPGGLLTVEQTPSTIFITGGAERVA